MLLHCVKKIFCNCRNTYEYQIEDTPEDDFCENDGDCSGYGVNCISGKCIEKPPEPQQCDTSETCSTDQMCLAGNCVYVDTVIWEREVAWIFL